MQVLSKEFVIVVVSMAFCLGCDSGVVSELESLNNEESLSSMRSDPISQNWLEREFPCKSFETAFQSNKDRLIRRIADRISLASPQYFENKKISEIVCLVSDFATPGNLNEYMKYAELQGTTKNAFPDARNGFLATGPGIEGEVELAGVIAHELSHFLLDHSNLWHPTKSQQVIAGRREIMPFFKEHVTIGAKSVAVLKQLTKIEDEGLDVSRELEEELERVGKQHEQFDRIHFENFRRVEKSLRAELAGHYKKKYRDELRTFGYLVEAEADEVGLSLFVAAGYKAENYSDKFARSLFNLPHLYQICKDSIANGTKPNPGDFSGSHPDSCWRVWRIHSLLESKAGP